MPFQLALRSLHHTIDDAAMYLGSLDKNLGDGDQTVHAILAHLVFWHREYVRVLGAIADGHKPKLRTGKYRELNALACREFQNTSPRVLTKQLIRLQSELESVVAKLPSANVKLAFKQGSKPQRIGYWLPRIQAHIDGHLARLRRIERKKRST